MWGWTQRKDKHKCIHTHTLKNLAKNQIESCWRLAKFQDGIYLASSSRLIQPGFVGNTTKRFPSSLKKEALSGTHN